MKKIKSYKAYIASNEFSTAFNYAFGSTASSAIAAVKRKSSPDWKDCKIWCVFVHINGQEEKL